MSVTEFAKYRMKSDKEFQAQIEIWFDEGKNGLHDFIIQNRFVYMALRTM
jgi:hypothetical protein